MMISDDALLKTTPSSACGSAGVRSNRPELIEAPDHDKAGLGKAMKIIDRISDSFETRLTDMEARLESERVWHEAATTQGRLTSSQHGTEELLANLTAVCQDVEDLRRQQIKSNCEIQLLRTQLDIADQESESTNDTQSRTSMSKSCSSSLGAITRTVEELRTELRNELQQLRGRYLNQDILEEVTGQLAGRDRELQQVLGQCTNTRMTLEEQGAHGCQLEATQARHSQEIEVLQQQCSQLAGSLQANLAAIRGEFVDLCERSARMAEGLQGDFQDSVRSQVLHAVAQQQQQQQQQQQHHQSSGSDADWRNVEARVDELQRQLAEHEEVLEGPCRLDAQLLQRLAEGHGKLSLEVESLQLALQHQQKKLAGAKQDDAVSTTSLMPENLEATLQELRIVQGSLAQQQQQQSTALIDLESAKRVFEEALDAETTRRCSLIADLHARLAREIAEVQRQVGFKTGDASRSPCQIDWECPQDVERLAAMIKKECQKQRAIHGATTVDYGCRNNAEETTTIVPPDTKRQDFRNEKSVGSGAISPREYFGGSLNVTPAVSIRATPARQHSSERGSVSEVGSHLASPGYPSRSYLGQSCNKDILKHLPDTAPPDELERLTHEIPSRLANLIDKRDMLLKEHTETAWARGEQEPQSILGSVEVSSEKQQGLTGLVRRPLPAHRLSTVSRDWLTK